MTPPTNPQWREALTEANEVRYARAQLKRDITAGKVSALEVLQQPADYVQGMKLREVLLAVPRLGPKKVDGVMQSCRLSHRKTIGELQERQIWELDERLSPLNAWCSSLVHH